MRTTIRRWGNSLAVRIPKSLAEETAFDEGDEVDLRADDDRIFIERPQPKQYRLGDLLDGITKTNRHDAVEFGDPVNREAW
jgi:antitoxin MazE